jgi:prepilin-type N-terminal cleavage/methylation domain-containing protein
VERQVKSQKSKVKSQKLFGSASGVTLIELLIVVAIAGAMVSIVLPTFSNGLENMRLSQASDSVAAFLNGALNRAERRQQAMEITISPRENLIQMRSADASFFRKLELPDGIRAEGTLPKPPGDTGDARGFLLLPGSTPPRIGVQLANRLGRQRVVSIDPITGVPKIERPEIP